MAYFDEVLADTPVVYYRLGEASGAVAVDSSGNGNDGAYVDTPTLGQVGPLRAAEDDGAVLFNGTSEYLRVSTAAPIGAVGASHTRSFEFWFRDNGIVGRTAIGGTVNAIDTGTFVHIRTHWGTAGIELGMTAVLLRDEAGNRLDVRFNDSRRNLYDGEWHHCVIVQSTASTILFFVDGIPLEEQDRQLTGVYSNPAAWDVDFGVAVVYRTSAAPFAHCPCFIDEFAIYDYALSTARVEAHYVAGKPDYQTQILEDGPVGYWPLDEASGLVAEDLSGNNFDGTYVGGPGLGADPIITEGKAVGFVAGSQVTLPNAAALKPALPVTLEYWARLDALSGIGEDIVANDDRQDGTYHGVWSQITATGVINGNFGDGGGAGGGDRRSGTGSVALVLGERTHVVVVVRGATDMDFYINGVADPVISYGGSGGGLAYSASNGRIFSSVANDSPIVLDEVAIYDYELGPARVLAHYLAGTFGLDVNDPPAAPTLTVVEARAAAGEADLASSAFSDPDAADAHAGSQWQVDAAGGDFSAPVFDSGEDAVNLTSITATGLPAVDLVARVRHKDDSGDAATEWGPYSAEVAFSMALWGPCPPAAAATGWAEADESHEIGGGGGGVGGGGGLVDPEVTLLQTGLLFADNFNRANGPVGNGWGDVSGIFGNAQVTNNRVQCPAAPGVIMRDGGLVPSGEEDGQIVEGIMFAGSPAHEGVLDIARQVVTGGPQGYRLHASNPSGLGDALHLIRALGGSIVATFPSVGIPDGVTYRIRIAAAGRNLRGYVGSGLHIDPNLCINFTEAADPALGSWWGPTHLSANNFWDDCFSCGSHIKVRGLPVGWSARITREQNGVDFSVTEAAVAGEAVFDARGWILPAVTLEILDDADLVVLTLTPAQHSATWPGGIWGGDVYEVTGVGTDWEPAEPAVGATAWSA